MERIWKILTDFTLAGNDTPHGNYRPQLKESPHEREKFQRPKKNLSEENMSRVFSEYMNILNDLHSAGSENHSGLQADAINQWLHWVGKS